jgi:hypothetical protein
LPHSAPGGKAKTNPFPNDQKSTIPPAPWACGPLPKWAESPIHRWPGWACVFI